MAVSKEEIERLKKEMYDKLNPRRRKYIDKIGYDNWDPFQEPQDPIDLRKDKMKMTTQELISKFLRSVDPDRYNDAYAKGAFELCLGIINEDEKALGGYDFVKWYLALQEELAKQEDENK